MRLNTSALKHIHCTATYSSQWELALADPALVDAELCAPDLRLDLIAHWFANKSNGPT